MSPKEQLDIMCSQEEEMRAKQREPNEKDLEASIDEFSNEPIIFTSPFFWHIVDVNFTHTEAYVLHRHGPHLCAGPPASTADDERHAPAATWNWGYL